MNVLSDYDAKCEEFLAKAVKLNPNTVDAVNELGLCLWKKSDIAGAKNCFESALDKVGFGFLEGVEGISACFSNEIRSHYGVYRSCIAMRTQRLRRLLRLRKTAQRSVTSSNDA